MFGSLGMGELLVILVIVVVIFGANKIPQLGKGLGEGIRGFRDAMNPKPQPPAVQPPAQQEEQKKIES